MTTSVTLLRRVARRIISIAEGADASLFGTEFANFNRVFRAEVAGSSLLDVGCGRNSPVVLVRNQIGRIVGVDAHLPSILDSRSQRRHDGYVSLDVLQLASTIRGKSFDCVIAIDVIEHITKEQGFAFLTALEAIARRRVVVFTPNGFLSQSATPDNPYQEHISGWSATEMRSRGYRVIGISGWRPLRGEYAVPRKPRWLMHRLSLITERWFESRPKNAFQILCVKDVAPEG